jgi:hypothetical protein
MFYDEGHLKTIFAKPLAHVVSHFLDVANDYWMSNKHMSMTNVRVRYNLASVNRITYHGCNDMIRSTSLACYPVHQMQSNSRIEIKTYELCLCGILFWLCREDGFIFCKGKRTIRKNLLLPFSKGFFFRNFFNPLEPSNDGYFTLSSSYSGMVLDEYTQREEPYIISGDAHNPRFEIADFLFCQSNHGVFFAALVKELVTVRLSPALFRNQARQIYSDSLLPCNDFLANNSDYFVNLYLSKFYFHVSSAGGG